MTPLRVVNLANINPLRIPCFLYCLARFSSSMVLLAFGSYIFNFFPEPAQLIASGHLPQILCELSPFFILLSFPLSIMPGLLK